MFKTHRKKNKLIGITSLVLGVLIIAATTSNIANITTYISRAFGTKADIIIDSKGIIGPINRPWKNIAQGGESPSYRFFPVNEQIQALDPDYIRIDHIYDFYDVVSRRSDRSLAYNWTKLDEVINDITQAGSVPFISLSYMPPELGEGDITGKPIDWQEWSQLVQNTIQHISGVSGLSLQNVYYEVWNEPDLFGQWRTYGEKNYLQLYYYAAKGAQNTTNTNQFYFGGPATTALYPNWVTRFIDYIIANDLPLDFYSWHLYSSSISDFTDSIEQFQQLMRNYPDLIFSVQPMITEWGHDSANHIGYDTQLSAAHTIAVATQIESQLDKAFLFELQDGKDPQGQEYWGRWGMLTHQDFGSTKKPRYHAITALNQLSDQRLSLIGQGSWVKALATKDPATGSITTIMTNYDSAGRNVETVPLTIKRLDPGSYQIIQTYLQRPPQASTVQVESDLNLSIPLGPNQSITIIITPTQYAR